jgi:beta-xylosidase
MVRYNLVVLIALFFTASCSKENKNPEEAVKPPDEETKNPFYQADPTVFYDKGTYYLYGTNDQNADVGFQVFTSTDLKKWTGPSGAKTGYALVNGDSYGTAGFWAPQVFLYNNTYYMAYTANENIAIAYSDSPLGPFIQTVKQPLPATGKQIDPFVFFDSNGKIYLYHVRLQNGNRIFVAEMEPDLSGIKTETLKECITATTNPQPWEKTSGASVSEGPTVIKHNNLYYLFYSANDFRNIDYAVGYAVSASPMGPWEKYSSNPVISRKSLARNGPGHGDLFTDAKGGLQYVLHVHNSETVVIPRRTALVSGQFIANGVQPDKMVIEPSSFTLLSYSN